MADYRLYFYDLSGHIKDVEVLNCANDADAEALAEQKRGEAMSELWQRARQVKRFAARREKA
jgi:hypothetical protein